MKPAALKRPMDPGAMGNDTASLRALCGMLNDPNITGAEVPPEERAAMNKLVAGAAAAIPEGQPAPLPKLTKANVLPKPAQKQQPVSGAVHKTSVLVRGVPTLFFTGHSRVGKSWLAAQLGATVLEFDDPIYAMAATAFGPVQDKGALNQFVGEVRAWGDGNDTTPMTPARALFTIHIRSAGKDGLALFGVNPQEFGTPGFWIRSLLSRAVRANDLKNPIVVTSVETTEQYQGLRQAGFAPYHVLCNSLTRSARGGKPLTNPLADGIERDITTKLSQTPSGMKFWAVWNDDKYPVPSPRLLSVDEFLSQIRE